MVEYRYEPESHLRMLVLVTVLQRNLGVRYNLAFSEGEYDASDPRNLFLHGLLSGHGGTCATMPVLYTAIGRRLGYPLKLVHAREHLFCRWDDPNGERFNIEATSAGLNLCGDDYYRTFPKPITQEQIDKGLFLRSLEPREELASFLVERSLCLLDHLKFPEAVKASYFATHLAPMVTWHKDQWVMASVMAKLVDLHNDDPSAPPGVPVVLVRKPTSPLERGVYPKVLRNVERILKLRKARLKRTEYSITTVAFATP
jgi:hypothetical protein